VRLAPFESLYFGHWSEGSVTNSKGAAIIHQREKPLHFTLHKAGILRAFYLYLRRDSESLHHAPEKQALLLHPPIASATPLLTGPLDPLPSHSHYNTKYMTVSSILTLHQVSLPVSVLVSLTVSSRASAVRAPCLPPYLLS
jgi:hypothetical protein